MSGEKYSRNNTRAIKGKELMRVRIAANKSLRELAEALCCNKSQLSRWEQEKQIPSEERIDKLIAFLGTDSFVIPNVKNMKLIRELFKQKVEGNGDATSGD